MFGGGFGSTTGQPSAFGGFGAPAGQQQPQTPSLFGQQVRTLAFFLFFGRGFFAIALV
jgi:hypothetical protein